MSTTQEALADALESIEAITNEEHFIRSADSKLYEIRSIASRALSQHVLGAQPLPAQPEGASSKFKLWFFRDLSDEQRLALFKLHGLPTDEINTHATQRMCLDHLFATPPAPSEPAQPVPAGDVGALKKHLHAFADSAYCKGMEVLRRDQCLGEEHKLKQGTFGRPELEAHREAAKHFGAHFGIYGALKTFVPQPAQASTQAPVAWMMRWTGHAPSVTTDPSDYPSERDQGLLIPLYASPVTPEGTAT